MNNESVFRKLKFYISESKNFRNDGYVQLHYKNLIKDILIAISDSKTFTDEELSSIFQKEIVHHNEEFLKL